MALFEAHAGDEVNLALNVTPMLDHNSGVWVKGIRGNWILVGGYGFVPVIMAEANCGKTGMLLSIYATGHYRYPTSDGIFYETEGTMPKSRLTDTYQRIDPEGDLWGRGIEWVKKTLPLDHWADVLSAKKNERFALMKTAKNLVTLPFELSPGNNKTLPFMLNAVDSFAEAEPHDAARKLEKEGVAASVNQTYDMIVGNIKTRIMRGISLMGPAANMMTLMSGSVDSFVDTNSQPGRGPAKTNAHLDAKKKPKGMGTKVKKLSTSSIIFGIPKPWWKGTDAKDRIPKTPLHDSELIQDSKSYEHVEFKDTRSKAGESGFVQTMVSRQGEGPLWDVSIWWFLKDYGAKNPRVSMGDYGLINTKQYHTATQFLPEVDWRTNTLRQVLRDNPKVGVAFDLLYGLKFEYFIGQNPEFLKRFCTPEELYNDLKALGYDWNELLDTRYWWTHLESEKGLPPQLTCLDLLCMRTGEYIPYWFTKEKRAEIQKNLDARRKG